MARFPRAIELQGDATRFQESLAARFYVPPPEPAGPAEPPRPAFVMPKIEPPKPLDMEEIQDSIFQL